MTNLFSLSGRVAFVSGAAGHLGREMSFALARAGAHVILNGRDEAKLTALREALGSEGLKASVLAFDISEAAQRERGVAAIERELGRLDVLVNNAYDARDGTLVSAKPEDFDRAYALTVTPAFHLVQLARKVLASTAQMTRGGASVINISTMYAHVSPDPGIYGDTGFDNPPFYGPAKAGLLQLTRYFACHLAAERIRVNSISPGAFPHPSLREASPPFYDALCRKAPLGRTGDAAEIAGPVLFLAGDASSFVTGADLRVDGGWTAW